VADLAVGGQGDSKQRSAYAAQLRRGALRRVVVFYGPTLAAARSSASPCRCQAAPYCASRSQGQMVPVRSTGAEVVEKLLIAPAIRRFTAKAPSLQAPARIGQAAFTRRVLRARIAVR
jgi:hypothetical protein